MDKHYIFKLVTAWRGGGEIKGQLDSLSSVPLLLHMPAMPWI